MNIQELTKHPELLNRETLFELRRMTASYPYYQPARLLMIKNLYLLHDPSFDEELRRAALYFTDRKILFNIVEAAHYRLKRRSAQSFSAPRESRQAEGAGESRTVSLIDSFLSTIPEDAEAKKDVAQQAGAEAAKRRKPTAADATVDYVAYLLATDFEELDETTAEKETEQVSLANTKMNGGDLIDAFINNENGRITLQDEPEYFPEEPEEESNGKDSEDEFLTETLAGIYIKQGNYTRALDIINKINEKTEKKNLYVDDQKRFLAKLIANQKTK